MNIDGMGDALVDQLVDRGMVKSVSDIYSLTEELLVDLERAARIERPPAGQKLFHAPRQGELPVPCLVEFGRARLKDLAEHGSRTRRAKRRRRKLSAAAGLRY